MAKVIVVGFKMRTARGLSYSDLLQDIAKHNGERRIIKHADRITYVWTDLVGTEPVAKGVVYTFREDQSRMRLIQTEDGEWITVMGAEGNQPGFGADGNLFMLSLNTGHGLVYNFRGSTSPDGFRATFRETHDDIREAAIRNYVRDRAEKHRSREAAEASAKKQLGGRFALELLTSKRDLDELLERYDEIAGLVVSSQEIVRRSAMFRPAESFIKTVKTSIEFDDDASTDSIKTYLRSNFQQLTPFTQRQRLLTLVGLGENGEDLREFIGKNRRGFEQLDYETYADEVMLKASQVGASQAMRRLKSLMSSHSELMFGHN